MIHSGLADLSIGSAGKDVADYAGAVRVR